MKLVLAFNLLLIIPSISFSQEGGYQRASKRIEEAVRQGQITREQANERYRNLEQRLQNQGKRGQRSNNIAFHFEKLGIKNIDNIKLKLKNQGVTDTHIESVLGGMIRVVHAAKNEGNEFVLNPRIKTYFQNECGLSPNQIEFIRNFSIELAR